MLSDRTASIGSGSLSSAAYCAMSVLLYWLIYEEALSRRLGGVYYVYIISFIVLFTFIGFAVGRKKLSVKLISLFIASYICSSASYMIAIGLLHHNYKYNVSGSEIFYISLFGPFILVKGWVPGVVGICLLAGDALIRIPSD